MRKGTNSLILLALLLGASLFCTAQSHKGRDTKNFKKLESYTIRGRTASYYRIPVGLSREDLIKTARKICDSESPGGRLVVIVLIFIDDVSGLRKYINYAKRASDGDMNAKLPKVWADKHIVANAQRTMNGGWMLYESNGYVEIGYLQPKTPEKE